MENRPLIDALAKQRNQALDMLALGEVAYGELKAQCDAVTFERDALKAKYEPPPADGGSAAPTT